MVQIHHEVPFTHPGHAGLQVDAKLRFTRSQGQELVYSHSKPTKRPSPEQPKGNPYFRDQSQTVPPRLHEVKDEDARSTHSKPMLLKHVPYYW